MRFSEPSGEEQGANGTESLMRLAIEVAPEDRLIHMICINLSSGDTNKVY